MARPEPTVWGIFWWSFARWGNVDSFHDLTRAGLPSTIGRATLSVDRFLADARDRTGIFATTEARIRPGVDWNELAASMVRNHMENARTYLDSAVLIFA